MPNHPTGVIPPEYRGAIRRRERRDGYRVLRAWLYATPNEGIAPEPFPFAELLRTYAHAVGSGTRLVPVPLAPLVTLARRYELLTRHPRIRPEQLRRLAEDEAFPIEAAIRDLGYAPRPFSSGIGDEARLLGLAV